jgi:hypothetical protein
MSVASRAYFLFRFEPSGDGDSEAGHVDVNRTKQNNWHTRHVTWNTHTIT